MGLMAGDYEHCEVFMKELLQQPEWNPIVVKFTTIGRAKVALKLKRSAQSLFQDWTC